MIQVQHKTSEHQKCNMHIFFPKHQLTQNFNIIQLLCLLCISLQIPKLFGRLMLLYGAVLNPEQAQRINACHLVVSVIAGPRIAAKQNAEKPPMCFSPQKNKKNWSWPLPQIIKLIEKKINQGDIPSMGMDHRLPIPVLCCA